MSYVKALERRLELDRRMRENMTPSPEGAYRVARSRLRLDLAAARQAAGLDPMPPRPEPVPVPAAPSSEFWAGLASEYVRGIQRLAPAAEDDAGAESDSASIAYQRGLDGRISGARIERK